MTLDTINGARYDSFEEGFDLLKLLGAVEGRLVFVASYANTTPDDRDAEGSASMGGKRKGHAAASREADPIRRNTTSAAVSSEAPKDGTLLDRSEGEDTGTAKDRPAAPTKKTVANGDTMMEAEVIEVDDNINDDYENEIFIPGDTPSRLPADHASALADALQKLAETIASEVRDILPLVPYM